MYSIDLNQNTLAIAAIVIAILSALIAAFSARQSLKSNRLNILPVLSLSISDDLKNTKITIKNIGVGVAHKVRIAPICILVSRRTPMRHVYEIAFSVPEKNYISIGEETTIEHAKHPLAWYLKSSSEGTVLLPIFYSDSIGTRYITILTVGLGRIDIKVSPSKYGIWRYFQYHVLMKLRTKFNLLKFKVIANDKKLRRTI